MYTKTYIYRNILGIHNLEKRNVLQYLQLNKYLSKYVMEMSTNKEMFSR